MRRIIVGVSVLFMLALGVSACGGDGGDGEAGKGEDLTVGMFTAFSGPNADLAIIGVAGCVSAQNSINAAGGVLGHDLKCERFDSGADPATAVPAASRMLATASNLALVEGMPGEVGVATAPIISAQNLVMMSSSGDPHFNENEDPYFYRMVPADNTLAQAQAYWTAESGYKNVAMVFETGSESASVIDPLQESLEKLGVNVTKVLKVAADQPSYRPEVQELLSSNPEAILTESDPQTAATFFSQLLELNDGQMIPLVGTTSTVVSSYQEPLVKAIGAENVEQYFEGTTVAPSETGPALEEYQSVLAKSGSEVPDPELYKNEPYSLAFYDCAVASALAMVAAESTSPEEYQPFIGEVTGEPSDGRVEVNTFAEGAKELEAGKKIVYMGAGGPMVWDEFHNRSGTFQALKYNPANRENEVVGTITPEDLAKALG